MPDTIPRAITNTIQTLPDARSSSGNAGLSDATTLYITRRNRMLPPWGSRRREQYLRAYYRHELNTLVQGAFAGLAKKVKSSPWEVSGPKSGVTYFQDVLRNAEFGDGWGVFVSKVVLDYLRHDIGAFVEVIGPGKPNRAMTGRVTGLAHLDSLRCYPTGDPEFPVVYWSKKGGKHLLHRSRVLHIVDMPDGDEDAPGVGLCALSRAAAVVQREIAMNEYVNSELDDRPSPGIMLASNLTQANVEKAIGRYQENQQRDQKPTWGDVLWIYGLQVEYPAKLESIAFNQPPEKFDYRTYKVDIDVNELALALGVDVQELWQLTGNGQLGTAGQSAILSAKSRGKAFGDILKTIERELNDVLPPAYEFEFKFEDNAADQERAQVAQTWVGVVASANMLLTPDEARRILANKVAEIRDAITDEGGQIARLADADPEDAGQIVDDVGEAPEPPETENTAPAEDATQTDQKARKDWDATRSEFASLVVDAVNAAQGGAMDKRRFGIVMRAHLRRMGLQAYRDGLQAGGVDPEDMDERDQAAQQEWLRLQSEYVTKFAGQVFNQGLSETQVSIHAEMWGNKSLRDAYQLGLASAGWNAPHLWKMGPTIEHCSDCLRLASQVHRLRDWKKKGWMPGSQALSCHGYNCLCQLVPAPGKRASGRF